MRIVLSGGGTGGHITPILALAKELKANGHELYYIGEESQITAELLRGSGLPMYSIKAGKLRRYHSQRMIRRLLDVRSAALNLRDSSRVVAGFGKSLRLLRRLKPDVVFAKGGYVGLPVGLAAAVLRIPIVIHESDTKPGLTNRVLARYAKFIAVGWPKEHYEQWQGKPMHITGVPVRDDLVGQSARQAKASFCLDEKLPVITITGGSRGAHNLNVAVFKLLDQLVRHYQLLHITGHTDIASARAERQNLSRQIQDRYHPYDFLSNKMSAALTVADVVITRAGASALAELALLKKPTIVVPNPMLTGGHQTFNAQAIAKQNAGVIIEEAELTDKLLSTLSSLFAKPERLQQLGINLGTMARPNANRELAQLIVKAAQRGE